MNSIKVCFSAVEWKDLLKCVSTRHDTDKKSNKVYVRKTFTVGFENKLNEKLKDMNFKCWLKMTSNWFKQIGGGKVNAPFWRGRFVCRQPCKIENYPDGIQSSESFAHVVVECVYDSREPEHGLIGKNPRLTGEERKQLMTRLCSDSIMNIRDFRVLFHSLCS